MSVARERALFEILDEALEKSPNKRKAFLDQACSADAGMREEIEALLDTEIESGLLSEPAFSVHAADVGIGRRIGPYKLVRLLDRGGMGSVYLAEREDFEQQVALKLIRRGLDVDDLMVRRFENERQILARLDHPNIARLLDGGTTDDRLPYFVMEYVEGVPIDRYCKAHELSIEERLDLFRKVCSAVQYAHWNLVVHRDLKPANILITADGQPRLLDFGIAKLLDDSLAASAVATVTGQAAMTPRYASPEQIQLEAVTTASDVYSLGVLLYEMLTGLDPYGVDKRRSDEVARAVCETEPDRPSTAVRRRAAEPEDGETRRLQRRLSGDLDSIVLKAMRKEPDQRYASAEQLSEDLWRHREGLPVGAQTGSFRYRAGKFVRRYQSAILVASAFVLLILGLGLVLSQNVQERKRAEREFQRASTVSEFLEDLIKSADPDESKGENLTVLDALQRGKGQVAEKLKHEPELQIYMAGTLGQIFRKLGAYENAQEMMTTSLEAARNYYQGDHDEVATRLNNLAVLFYDFEHYDEAELRFRQVLAMRERLRQDPERLFRTKSNLAITLLRRGELEKAEDLSLQVLLAREAAYKDAEDDKDVATSRHRLAEVYYIQGLPTEAEPLLRKALESRRGDQDNVQSASLATTLDLLGSVLAAQDKDAEARDLYHQAFEMRRDLLTEAHPDVAKTRKNLAAILAKTDLVKAEEYVTKALDVFNNLNPDGWDAAEAKSVLGMIYVNTGRYEEAEPLLTEEGYDRMIAIRDARTYRSQLALQRIVDLYEAWGKPDEAERYQAMLDSIAEKMRS